jgi:hypothetical protein
MRNVSDKNCRKNQNTHFMFSNFFRKSYRFWDNVKNMVETEGSQTTISRRVACWISKATRAQAHARARTLTRLPPPPHPHTRMHLPTIARTRAQKYVILYFLLFHGIKDFLNAPQYYVVRTLLVLLNLAPDEGELLPWRLATSPAGKTPFPVLYETSWDRGLV